MTDIPIIFSAPMVQALLSGRKTMTRRLAWRDAKFGLQDLASEQLEDMELRGWDVVGEGNEGMFRVYKPTSWQKVKAGDRLWVRENFARNEDQLSDTFMDTSIVYAADGKGRALDNGTEKPWTPCIHMPRSVSRLTLVVTGTKVERLQDLSHDDAMAEGVQRTVGFDCYGVIGPNGGWLGSTFNSAPAAFSYLWMSLHGAESWNENPEVVALSFRVMKANIDAPEAMAA